MSGYIIEEPNEEPRYYNSDNKEVEEYWRLYSPLQRKRFTKVIRQINETWYDVMRQFNFMRQHISLEESNALMLKVHKLFIVEHRHKTEYYNEEKLRQRRQKGYLNTKLNKLKKSKSKL